MNAGASRGHKYGALLALLLVALAVQSFDARIGVDGTLSDICRAVLAVAMLFVVFERPRERGVMAVIVAAAFAIALGRDAYGAKLDTSLYMVLSALISLFDWTAVWVILRDLLRRRAVGAENVLGAICGYLIAGAAWAGVNDIAYLAVPAAYGFSPGVEPLLADWHGRHALFAYYGFAQMLTIGYSDVTPVRAPATTLSLLGALFGVFYTAVVVSQLVQLAQSEKRPPEDH